MVIALPTLPARFKVSSLMYWRVLTCSTDAFFWVLRSIKGNVVLPVCRPYE